MTPEHLPDPIGDVPGPRARVTLDIAQASLDLLRSGEDVVRVWLSEPEPDVFSLHAQRTVGQTRASGEKPVADVLVECINELVDSINEHIEEVPQPVLDTLDKITERYIKRNSFGVVPGGNNDD